ncbi:MAG: 1-acyl-sn-glycerol-3-phosphate acyltransferase [Candidatus Omnitrophica bacterium]|nr:1-acyl-sn-glycerol-3-phosphate acyltransferase [Candidatus Omnitrophota bacterium]
MLYWIFKWIFFVVFNILYKLKIEGIENLPGKTNFILVANHTSYLDALIVGAVLQKKIYWIAWRDLYKKWWIKWFMFAAETMPEGSSSERAIYFLMRNKNVGLFPEGTRSHDGNLREFKSGAALLALKTGRPIVPCAILGAYEAFPRGAKFPRFFLPLKIKLGEPIYLLKRFENIIDDIDLQEGTIKTKKRVEEMINAR